MGGKTALTCKITGISLGAILFEMALGETFTLFAFESFASFIGFAGLSRIKGGRVGSACPNRQQTKT